MHNHLFNFETLPNIFPSFQGDINPWYLFYFYRYCSKQANEGTPSLICILNFHWGQTQQNLQQGNYFPYVHSKFSFGAKCAKIFFNISQLFSTNYSCFAFSNIALFYVTVNFFPIYCYFMSTTPPHKQVW